MTSYSYQEESSQINDIRQWIKFQESHVSLQPPFNVTQRDSTNRYYSVQIQGISGIPQNQKIQTKLHFYHKKQQAFFGRTLTMHGIGEVAYFITNMRDPDTVGILEIIHLDIRNGNYEGSNAIGWAVLNCFNEQRGQPAQVFKGSARILTKEFKNGAVVPNTSVQYETTPCDSLRSIETLLPLNTLCGSNELLPGVQGSRLPRNPLEQFIRAPPLQLSISNIQVMLKPELERSIELFAGTYAAEQGYTQPQNTGGNITDRKLSVGIHNGWTFISGGGASETLMRKNRDGNLENSQQMNISDLVNDQNCALIFELEYTLLVQKKTGESPESLKLTLCWAPYIPTYVGSAVQEGQVAFALLTGPGRSASGKMLWSAGGKSAEMPFEIRFTIGSSGMPMPYHPPSIQDHHGLETPRNDLIGQQLQMKENQIRALEMQLENERKKAAGQQFVPFTPTPPYQPPVPGRPLEEIPTPYHPGSPGRPTGFIPGQPAGSPGRPTGYIPGHPADPHFREIPQHDYREDLHPSPQRMQWIETLPAVSTTGIVEEKSFVAAPMGQPKVISRSDKARLVKAGVKGLLDRESIDPGESKPNLALEAQDPLKATSFLIQFLTFKPEEDINPPQRICFSTKFFTYPSYNTDKATVALGAPGQPTLLQREGPEKELVVKYDIEPGHKQDTHIELARYLATKQLTIDVWDADSLLHYGYIRVPLARMMRQGRPMAHRELEFDIFDNDVKKGSIQIMFRNIGKTPAIQDPSMQPSQGPQKVSSTSRTTQKRKVKSRKLEYLPGETQPSMTNDEQRKQQRILEWKKNSSKPDEWQKSKDLREVNVIRENRKAVVIKDFLRQYISTAQAMPVCTGKSSVIQYTLSNPFDREECFSIRIDDPDKELSLITSHSEWQWWVSQHHYDRPAEWDMITADNSFVLRPGESIPLLFKFLSYRQSAGGIENPGTDYLRQKTVCVWVDQTRGAPLCALELEVIPQSTPVDHVFRFYEAANRTVKLVLPNIYSDIVPAERPILTCTLPNAVVLWETEREISVRLKVGDAQTLNTFNIFAYGDPFNGELMANWQIDVHSLISHDVRVTSGQTTVVTLMCPGDEARQVCLFSSDSRVVSFRAPHNAPFPLLPRSANSFPAVIRSDTSAVKRVRVNCVDVYTRQLIHSWVLRIESEATTVTNTYPVRCQINTLAQKQIIFTNRSQQWVMFHFRSSHPKLLRIEEPKMALEAGASGHLMMAYLPNDEVGRQEICVFASDEEETLFECLLFKVEYS